MVYLTCFGISFLPLVQPTSASLSFVPNLIPLMRIISLINTRNTIWINQMTLVGRSYIYTHAVLNNELYQAGMQKQRGFELLLWIHFIDSKISNLNSVPDTLHPGRKYCFESGFCWHYSLQTYVINLDLHTMDIDMFPVTFMENTKGGG